MPAAGARGAVPPGHALYIAVLLAAFTILFGARHLDATERHEGLVAAIAFESMVKLLAFLAVGAFVTFGIYGGFGDSSGARHEAPRLQRALTLERRRAATARWAFLTVLSMLSIMFLPRQFQISVVENVDEHHLGEGRLALPALPPARSTCSSCRRARRALRFAGAAWTRTPSS